jgi:hypothetical protein
MSDFLSNVTARALGTAQVVQPRIPSLFEPYRANEGPFVTRTAWNSADAAPEAEESRGTARIAGPQTSDAEPFQAQSPTLPQPQRRTQFDPNDTRAAENPAQPPVPAQPAAQGPSHPESRSFAARSEVSPPGPARTNPVRLGEAPQSPASSPAARPPGTAHGEAHSATGRAVSESESNPAHEQSVLGPASPPMAKPAVRPPVVLAMESSGPMAAAPPPTAAPAPGVNAPKAIAPAVKSESAAGADLQDYRLVAGPARIRRPESLRRPSDQAEQRDVEVQPRAATVSVVAPTAINRGDTARAPVALPAQSPAGLPVEITIGTVEVRAVFPEKPAPRAPSRRPKPGISLDDYLKRSSRGAR